MYTCSAYGKPDLLKLSYIAIILIIIIYGPSMHDLMTLGSAEKGYKSICIYDCYSSFLCKLAYAI